MISSIKLRSISREFLGTSAYCTRRVSSKFVPKGRSVSTRCVRNPSANSTRGSPTIDASGRLALTNSLRLYAENRRRASLNGRGFPNDQEQDKREVHHRTDLQSQHPRRVESVDNQARYRILVGSGWIQHEGYE